MSLNGKKYSLSTGSRRQITLGEFIAFSGASSKAAPMTEAALLESVDPLPCPTSLPHVKRGEDWQIQRGETEKWTQKEDVFPTAPNESCHAFIFPDLIYIAKKTPKPYRHKCVKESDCDMQGRQILQQEEAIEHPKPVIGLLVPPSLITCSNVFLWLF